jgi:hypothetical protein
MVHHALLMKKIDSMLPSWMSSWIAQYLSSRKQTVKIENNLSSWKPIEAGVIKGSVLGPILFLSFVSDIIDQKTKLIKYADTKRSVFLLTYWQNEIS